MPFDPKRIILEPEVRRRVRAKAWSIWNATRLPTWDLTDIEAELTQQLLARLQGYNPARSPLRQFIPLVLKNLAKNLHRKLRTEMRYRGRCAHVDPRDVDDASRPSGYGRNEQDLADLIRDVQSLIRRQPRRDRALAMLLRVMPMADAAGILGQPRSTLYASLHRLRRRFEDAGLRDYLG